MDRQDDDDRLNPCSVLLGHLALRRPPGVGHWRTVSSSVLRGGRNHRRGTARLLFLLAWGGMSPLAGLVLASPVLDERVTQVPRLGVLAAHAIQPGLLYPLALRRSSGAAGTTGCGRIFGTRRRASARRRGLSTACRQLQGTVLREPFDHRHHHLATLRCSQHPLAHLRLQAVQERPLTPAAGIARLAELDQRGLGGIVGREGELDEHVEAALGAGDALQQFQAQGLRPRVHGPAGDAVHEVRLDLWGQDAALLGEHRLHGLQLVKRPFVQLARGPLWHPHVLQEERALLAAPLVPHLGVEGQLNRHWVRLRSRRRLLLGASRRLLPR
mmetsp:Transcript_72262/g.215620  ORF Transcript_72262/g.215620 Transcript_72262/m.215620 type:complete len:328 (+) Transcript_72262:113-1096(+)